MNYGTGQAWFGLRVRPQCEKLVSAVLRGRGYEEFLPLYQSTRRWADRVRTVDLPLFPGYLFCRFRNGMPLPVLTTPGLLQIEGLGPIPVPVDDAEIVSLQAILRSGRPLEAWQYLRAGRTVELQDGPLKGAKGRLIEAGNSRKLVVSITLLERSVAIDLDEASRVTAPASWLPALLGPQAAGLRNAHPEAGIS